MGVYKIWPVVLRKGRRVVGGKVGKGGKLPHEEVRKTLHLTYVSNLAVKYRQPPKRYRPPP